MTQDFSLLIRLDRIYGNTGSRETHWSHINNLSGVGFVDDFNDKLDDVQFFEIPRNFLLQKFSFVSGIKKILKVGVIDLTIPNWEEPSPRVESGAFGQKWGGYANWAVELLSGIEYYSMNRESSSREQDGK